MGMRVASDVVTVEGDVDDAGARAGGFGVELTKQQLKAGGDVDAAVGHAQQDQAGGRVGWVPGGDLCGNFSEGIAEVGGGDSGGRHGREG